MTSDEILRASASGELPNGDLYFHGEGQIDGHDYIYLILDQPAEIGSIYRQPDNSFAAKIIRAASVEELRQNTSWPHDCIDLERCHIYVGTGD